MPLVLYSVVYLVQLNLSQKGRGHYNKTDSRYIELIL